jgi:uncharacterized protein
MEIVFDPEKRRLTLLGRGLDMARSDEVLSGKTVTSEDVRVDYGETRFITVGYLDGRMVSIAWTRREGAYRIISMRKSNDREQKRYSSILGGP